MKMKKSLVYTIAVLALVLSTGFTAAISSFATTQQNSSNNLITTDSNLTDNNKAANLSKSENVYIITNPDGSVNKSFVNNTINTSSEPLPLNVSITYSLNGNEIKGEDLVGQSGHVKIAYKFTATKTYQNKLVPFLTITSLSLDPARFTNIHIDHGKIISESSSTLLAGYTFAGLNEDLGTDILPDSFTVTADVTNFELPNTYTFATNELFAEIDTTQLTSIDSIVGSINDLGAAFDKILAGSSELAKGSIDLATGAGKLASGIAKLDSGLSELSNHSAALNNGAAELLGGILSTTSENYDSILTNLINYLIQIGQIDQATELGQTKALITGLVSLSSGIAEYTGTVDYIASQTPALTAGANELASGASQLATGANTLNSGLTAFKQQGLNKLIDFANNNLQAFTANLRNTINAANSYHHYNNESATSVKFIFKTPSLK